MTNSGMLSEYSSTIVKAVIQTLTNKQNKELDRYRNSHVLTLGKSSVLGKVCNIYRRQSKNSCNIPL